MINEIAPHGYMKFEQALFKAAARWAEGVLWQGRYLKVVELPVSLVKLGRQQHNQVAFSV